MFGYKNKQIHQIHPNYAAVAHAATALNICCSTCFTISMRLTLFNSNSPQLVTLGRGYEYFPHICLKQGQRRWRWRNERGEKNWPRTSGHVTEQFKLIWDSNVSLSPSFNSHHHLCSFQLHGRVFKLLLNRNLVSIKVHRKVSKKSFSWSFFYPPFRKLSRLSVKKASPPHAPEDFTPVLRGSSTPTTAKEQRGRLNAPSDLIQWVCSWWNWSLWWIHWQAWGAGVQMN